MPEWLQMAVDGGEPLPPPSVIFARILLALFLGLIIAGVYRWSLGRRNGDTQTLPTTLVLLSVLLTLVTVVIGNSVARAFGLVGALSIVRFRTVVEDTRDTAFVIFAVVVGMGVGSGYALYTAMGIPVVLAASLIMNQFDWSSELKKFSATLTVRLGLGNEPDEVLKPLFEKYLEKFSLTGVATARQGAALDLTYSVHLSHRNTTYAFVAELNRIQGVQNVELRQP